MIERFIELKIKEAADIKDVVGEFCSLKKCGPVEFTCACPLHVGQHLGHFKVHPAKNFFHCFVCGEHGGPIDFLMKYPGTQFSYPDALKWLAARYGIDTGEEDKKFTNVRRSQPRQPPPPEEEKKEMVTLPLDYLKALRNTSHDNFCQWVRSLPWSDTQRERLERVLEAYLVGHSDNLGGATIFWQVDEQARVRTGKIMWFYPPEHPKYGHRDKSRNPTWVTKRMINKGLINEEKQEVVRCLFGLHLIHAQGYHSNTVNIVESEKTAIIMTIACGGASGLWMATGGLQFLKRDYIQTLINLGFSVVLHPDHDGDEKWKKKMQDFGFTYGTDYQVSNQFVTAYWTEADGAKADAADIIVRRLYDREERTCDTRLLADLIRQNPAVQLLREKFKLITIHEKQYPTTAAPDGG